MTPSQLLTRIKDLGTVDDKYIGRIQKQIDDPEKTVKLSAVVSYLVKKDQITKAQATELLKPPTEDEMVVSQPEEKDYDTGELIGDFSAKPKEMVVEPIIEEQPEILDANLLVEEPEPILDPVPIDEEMPFEQHPDPQEFEPVAPLDNFDDGFGSGAYPTTPSKEKKSYGFSGKRDQKDQFKTSWLYIAFGILGVLLIGVALLYIINASRNPDEMFKAAMDSYNRGAYADAEAKLANFIETYPSHEDVPTAEARRVHSILRGLYSAKQYPELIQQAEKQLTPLSEAENTKIGLIRDDLGVILPNALDNITATSTERLLVDSEEIDVAEMESELAQINEYKAVIDNPIFVSAGIRKKQSIANVLSDIDNNIRTIVGQIDKEKEYVAALGKIEQLREESKTDEAFNTYRRLIRNYGDLAARKPLQKLMVTISEKESQLVETVELDLQPTSGPRQGVIESTLVMAVKNGQPVSTLKDEVVPFLVEGAVYGIDAGTGTLVWRYFVGNQTLVPPVELDADRTLLSDRLHHELVCVSTVNGDVNWRVPIGEAFEMPVVAEATIVLSTESGKVIELDSATGNFVNAAQLPQSTGPAALVGQRDPYIYQVGQYSNLYVLSSQTFACEEVYSLGHYKDSVAVAPYQWTGFILVAVNGGTYCDLHVLKPDTSGLGLKRVQFLPRITDAPVTTPFIKAGRSLLMLGDNGQIQMLDIDPTSEESPIRPVTKVVFGDEGNIRPFVAADGSHVWQAGQGLMHARIKRNQGIIDRDQATEARDEFIAQIHVLDEYLMHVRRRADSGMISASLSDGMTLEPLWRTDFAGPLAGSPLRMEQSLVTVTNQGDVFQLSEDELQSGYSEDAIRSSDLIENLKFDHLLKLSDQSFVATSGEGRADLLYFNEDQAKLLVVSPPADKPTGEPMVVQQDVVVPSSTGYVARIKPESGSLRGTPFQPPISPNSKFNWLSPVAITETLVAVASAESPTDPSKLFLLSLEDESRVEKLAEIESKQPFKSRLASNGEVVFAALSGGGADKLAIYSNAAPLEQKKIIDLPGACVAGPWQTEAGVLVQLDDDKLYCFTPELEAKWSIDVENAQLACPPEVAGPQLMLCYQNGKVLLLEPTQGTLSAEFDLEQPVVHRPLIEGQKMYFSGMDGTLHVVDLGRVSE